MSEEDQTESLDFLLKPELIEKFIGMFDSRITALDDELARVETARKNIQAAQNELQEKKDILTNYQKFIKVKGFGYIKQTADEFFEEMRKANENRIPEPDDDYTCDEKVPVGPYVFKCTKAAFHDGECEFNKMTGVKIET